MIDEYLNFAAAAVAQLCASDNYVCFFSLITTCHGTLSPATSSRAKKVYEGDNYNIPQLLHASRGVPDEVTL